MDALVSKADKLNNLRQEYDQKIVELTKVFAKELTDCEAGLKTRCKEERKDLAIRCDKCSAEIATAKDKFVSFQLEFTKDKAEIIGKIDSLKADIKASSRSAKAAATWIAIAVSVASLAFTLVKGLI